MSYSQLNIIERSKLEALHRLVWTTREIVCELGRHHSLIAREIERGSLRAVYEAPVGSTRLSLPQHLVLLSATISLNLQMRADREAGSGSQA
ncbi:helix-turn-helix domain-containing protein [Paenibacillus sp. MER 180]|nr:helix-turn-helix domain-containing protein [Paenibacillus sp. MER 180]MCM3292093.1 helix-turn-helix domain-containing protein [Paenibacillus sp. MER 180]